MNGKALSLLTKADLAERCPGAGDVLHNILSMLTRDFSVMRGIPGSPVTPTRPAITYPLSPHSHPPTPTWIESPFSQTMANLLSANSVTMSPAPSVDSQAGSPPGHIQDNHTNNNNNNNNNISQLSQHSNNVYKSDSDEENQQAVNSSPPPTPTAIAAQRLSEVCVKDQPSPTLPPKMMPLTPGAYRPSSATQAREFFPNDPPEANTSEY